MQNKQTTLYRRILSITLLLLLQGLGLNLTSRQQSNMQQTGTDAANVKAQYASLPLAFEPNQGQVDGGTQYLAHHGQATTYFDGTSTKTTIGDDHITMSLDGANTSSFIGTDPLESRTNYFIGNDQSKWHSDIPNYKELLAKNVYPGIDLKYYGTNSQIEHDFIVNPGSDYKQIALHFDGQQDLSLDSSGNLILKAGESDLRLSAPITYQQSTNTKHTIPSHFELVNNTVTIALSNDYDRSQPLIIDPVLVYSTYLGGTGSDLPNSITVDANGNAYVYGSTTSTDFPTSSPFQASNAGGTNDIFISKLNAAGTALNYSTYLGGSGLDQGSTITVDISGNAYLGGYTSSTNFPTVTPFQASNAGGTFDSFVTKLNPSGSALTFSTYLGGGLSDISVKVLTDASGTVYVGGYTDSSNFPTASPYQASNAGGFDLFLAKFNATGTTLTYSTYLGGTGNDFSYNMIIDSTNNAYFTGHTLSSNYPTVGAVQSSYGGGDDAFLTKFNATGTALVYSTYLGGSGVDNAPGLAVDTSGNAYVSGFTTSTNFPTSSAYQASNAGGRDAFISKYNPAGSSFIYSTYLGGSGTDNGSLGAVDSFGNAYIIGYTTSTNFPTASAIQGTHGGGGNDAFVTKLNPAGSTLIYSTYLGGSGDDLGVSDALGLNNNLYITGYAGSTNFPTISPYQATKAGGTYDAFVAQISEDHTVNVTGQIAPTLQFSIGSTTCSMGFFSATQTQYCTHTMTAGSNATGGYVISYIPTTTLTSGANTITAMASQTASVVGIEQFGMNLKANTSAGSFTAANFGADPSGGSGTAMSGYQTADLFKFATGGGNIAQTTGSSLNTTYTVSFITNITTTSEAGTYSTPVTYNIVASY